jgi:hypothetical protein
MWSFGFGFSAGSVVVVVCAQIAHVCSLQQGLVNTRDLAWNCCRIAGERSSTLA